MRTFEGKIKLPDTNRHTNRWNGETEVKTNRSMFAVRRGLKLIHIGDGVWKIGREKVLDDGRLHQVIYSPDDKEYHIYNKTIQSLKKPYYDDGGNLYYHKSDHGNYADPAKTKIYILTSILDERNNWCFDLCEKPKNGKLKVIYDNGKVMNIDFNGEWLSYNTKTRLFTETVVDKSDCGYYLIHPVAYRKY